MSYEEILESICEESTFEKLIQYVGQACFDPGEFKELG
jgi:hypothetical protein